MIISWNVNDIKARKTDIIEILMAKRHPDVLAMQETKIPKKSVFRSLYTKYIGTTDQITWEV